MKTLTLVMLLIILNGCNIANKGSFRVTNSSTGGRITFFDPIETLGINPVFSLGSYTTSITTIPEGSKAEYATRSYSPFSGEILFEEKMIIEIERNK